MKRARSNDSARADASRRSASVRFGWATAVVVGLALSCGGATDQATDTAAAEDAAPASPEPAAPVVPVPPATSPRDVAVLEVRDLGEIHIELLPEIAPGTVDNFKKLAETDGYDDTTFHRVLPGFMIQGGDPNTRNENPDDDGTGGPGYTIDDEFGDLSFVRGIVAMANTGRANSAGSQFFIVHEDSRHLDGDYTAFGHVISGIEHVDAITQAPIDQVGRYGPRDRPREDVVIANVRLEPASGPVPAAEPSPSNVTTTEPKKKEWDEG